MRSLEKPHLLGGNEVSMSASIGIVTSDLAHADAEDIIRDADAAMYQAKLAGRAQFRFFDAAMHAQALERVTLEQDLRRADPESEFRVLYQPIVALSSGRIVGFEALIRWEHPTRGLLSPDAFIPTAEETGLIIHLGEWIFRQGCAQMRSWMDEFDDGHPVKLNINLSRRQLSHPGLLDMLTQIASSEGVPPARLRLEITETTVMDSRADVVSVMQAMRDAGFGLAMDDFGTGHSSLSCLHRFPIDVLKIDRSFISNLAGRRELSAVMHAIVTLAHHLGLSVVAEGVETGDQLAQLQAMECECAQGYLFDRPLTAQRATETLREERRRSLAA
jgi:EAL domain-containing protein (putative c-di-GMP-specific phosphodiesterase class I)